ncbi:MAG: peptidylprolyl isomerase [Planctomycetota bacterium]
MGRLTAARNPPRPFLASVLALLCPLAAAQGPDNGGPDNRGPDVAGRPLASEEAGPSKEAGPAEPVVARSGEFFVDQAAFDHALLLRHSGTDRGRAALEDLAGRKLLEVLAVKQGLAVDEDDLAERFAELDAEARANGADGGLRRLLEAEGVSLELFKERLRLQIVLERLVRLDLGIPADRPCTPEHQQFWLDAQVSERGIAPLPRPWTNGVAATVGQTIDLEARSWADALRTQMPVEDLRELAFQLVLAQAVTARLPDLSPEGIELAVRAEVQRRGAEAEADPAYQGVSFESLLATRGLTPELLAQDPAVRIAGLSTLFVDRSKGEAGLRAAYEAERDWFDDRFGKAVRARILYLVAAPERGPLTPRTFADAEEVLVGLKAKIATEADFERLARTQSEDPLSRDRGGDLGFVVPASENVPPAVRDEIFVQHGAGRTGLVGPIRLDNGVALLWLGTILPPPPWEEMKTHVHRELRRRFLVETLPPGSIQTVFDGPDSDE